MKTPFDMEDLENDLKPKPIKSGLFNLCKCGNTGENSHTCPFKEDINGDSETLCNCCSECRHECCMDI